MASNMLKMDSAADGMIKIIGDVVNEQLKRLDDTILCQIYKIYEDGTVDITVVPDNIHVITGVHNVLMAKLNVGDYVWVYRIGQNFNNSFVLYKPGTNVDTNINTQNITMVNSGQSYTPTQNTYYVDGGLITLTEPMSEEKTYSNIVNTEYGSNVNLPEGLYDDSIFKGILNTNFSTKGD